MLMTSRDTLTDTHTHTHTKLMLTHDLPIKQKGQLKILIFFNTPESDIKIPE